MPKLIKPDGTTLPLPCCEPQVLNEAVGGCIEAIPLGNGRFLVVNEDGKGLMLPHNITATTILAMSGGTRDYIVGNAVLCEPGELQ